MHGALLYDEIYGRLDEHFPTMTDDKNIFTPQESDEYDHYHSAGRIWNHCLRYNN